MRVCVCALSHVLLCSWFLSLTAFPMTSRYLGRRPTASRTCSRLQIFLSSPRYLSIAVPALATLSVLHCIFSYPPLCISAIQRVSVTILPYPNKSASYISLEIPLPVSPFLRTFPSFSFNVSICAPPPPPFLLFFPLTSPPLSLSLSFYLFVSPSLSSLPPSRFVV